MAMTIVMCSFSIPVPGGHMYLNDIVIVTAAVLLDPFCAFMAGGVGAFLGDVFFYPAPMMVSLVTHGLQSVVISLLSKNRNKRNSIIGTAIGWIITFTGYTLGRAFIYGTVEYAILKLPFQILQTLVGSVIALILCWKCGMVNQFDKMMRS